MSDAFEGVKTVLVVISSRAMAFDLPALRNFITHRYAGATVFFISASGDPMGAKSTKKVDLVIDLTEPGARQPLFFALKMRGRGRYVVGRKSKGLFGHGRYDRVFDEFSDVLRPNDYLQSERYTQRKVLELAGVPIITHGGTTRDLSHTIAQKTL